MAQPLNEDIAGRLEEVAQLLAEQGANRFRVHAYARAAETVRRLPRPVSDILEREGLEGLRRLPGIGESIARAIRDLLVRGRLAMLERLRGESDPAKLLASVPGIGRVLADRLSHDLGIETLEDLEAAAHGGRLAELLGFGPKRLAGIRDSLAHRLQRVRPSAPAADGSRPADAPPSTAEILDVDREYREKAAAGQLVRIAPRRFNPSHVAWLPVLHTTRGRRHYTALFSNSALAHRLARTHDWVVVHWDDDRGEHQCTVIWADPDSPASARIVRGRMAERETVQTGTTENLDAVAQAIRARNGTAPEGASHGTDAERR